MNQSPSRSLASDTRRSMADQLTTVAPFIMEPSSRDALLAKNLASQADQTKCSSASQSKEPQTSRSPKSDSGSRRQGSTPKLSRTLSRKVTIRDVAEDDLRYIYASYRLGALDGFADLFKAEGLKPGEFADLFLEYVAANYNGAWVIEAETKEGVKPAGFIVAWVRGRIMEIGDMVWFPWSTGRNVYESVVAFMERMRGDFVVLEFARMKDKKFFERIAKHGIMRKVGHAHSIYQDGPAVVFETVRKADVW